jgi:TolB protein
MIHTRIVFALLAIATTHPALSQDRYPIRQLSTSMDQEGFPTWSPDGKTIVFENVESGHFGLFKVAADGGVPARFTSYIGEHPKWSPDGQYLVFDADSGNSIKLMSAHGGRPVRIVPESIPVYRGGNPIWSPDGARVAFKADSALWILDIESGSMERVFGHGGQYPIPSCWARDGKSILLIQWERPPGPTTILRFFLTGETRVVLPPVEGKRYRYVEESPDGTLIAFAWCEGRNCDLWVAPSGGGHAVQLTMHPSYDDTPAWSPDGAKIAFTSARTGKMDVYVMDLDLEDLHRALKTVNK